MLTCRFSSGKIVMMNCLRLVLLFLLLSFGRAAALNPLDSLTYPVMVGASTMDHLTRQTTGRRDDWYLDFLVLNAITLASIEHQGQIRNGLLCCPSGARYLTNIKQVRLYDHDEWSAELIHPAAGFLWWAYLRRRGYNRFDSALMIAGLALTREWTMKAWGAPPSLDDPLIFTAGGVFFGTLAEASGMDFRHRGRSLEVYPLLQWDRGRDELQVGLTFPY